MTMTVTATEGAESDADASDEEGGLHLSGRDGPVSGGAVRPCDNCDGGILWVDECAGTVVCDSCHTAPDPARPPLDHDTTDVYPREADCYQRGHYNGGPGEEQGRVRLAGGYFHAYLKAVNGPEYAIDAYGEHTDGLLVPRKRDWRLSA